MSAERSQQPRAPQGSRGRRGLLIQLANPGFAIGLVLLVALAAGFEVVVRQQGYQLGGKLPAPLTKPLPDLDQDRLAPFGLIKPLTLQPDMLDQLGTKDYIQWVIADPYDKDGQLRRTTGDPEWGTLRWPQKINLFVTYYTDKPEQVPHIPERCYLGSGHTLHSQVEDTVEIETPDGPKTVKVLVLDFRRQGAVTGMGHRIVMYTFHANGAFRTTRQSVKRAVRDPRDKHAYFSKIELSVELASNLGEGYANTERAVEALKRLFQTAVPVLLEDHWPDWEALTGSRPVVLDEDLLEDDADDEGS